jgi:hypothetical protein
MNYVQNNAPAFRLERADTPLLISIVVRQRKT